MKSFHIRQFTAQYMDTYHLEKLHDFEFGFQFTYAIALYRSVYPELVSVKLKMLVQKVIMEEQNL